MQNAIQVVHRGTSFISAAKGVDIPRTTLMRLFKTVQVNDKIRKPKLSYKFMLTEKQQAEICARIFRLADVGMSITEISIRKNIFTYAEKMVLKYNFCQATKMAGRKCLGVF